MISLDLARQLRDSGMGWMPPDGDRFVIPDRGIEDRVFSICEMMRTYTMCPAAV